ncbi:MAG TPA: hypothetical protein VGL93_20035 [Streptosporangiaceae bacterium]|jgi:hypothetical protein
MGEFDLDLQVGGVANGWESVFRPQPGGAPGIVRMATDSQLGCAPSGGPTECATCYTCATCAFTCAGATGSPCAC